MAMQKITFSADADLLDRAEQITKAKGTTLEEEVRQWLDDFGWAGGAPATAAEEKEGPQSREGLKRLRKWRFFLASP